MNNSHLPPELDITTIIGDDELIVLLAGEADLANHQQLLLSLAEVPVDMASLVHLELSGLAFCDLEAFSRILTFAADVQATDRRVFMYGANAAVQKLARFLDAADVVTIV